MTNNIQKNQHKGNHRRVKTELEYEFYNKKSKVYNTQSLKVVEGRCNTQSREFRNFRQSTFLYSHQQTPKQREKNINNLTYNKWYIKPSVRLKKSLISKNRPDELDLQFAYNKLYQQNSLRQDCPFLTKKNTKLELLQKIPVHNLRLLEGFKKNQQMKKKRVPKIIELFLKKKNEQIEQ